MKLGTLQRFARSLPGVSEEPHHGLPAFRVRGRLFVTLPPGETHAHLFVDETDRERALAVHPGFVEKLAWGGKVVGIRVALAAADAAAVKLLVRQAWRARAPQALRAWAEGQG